MPIENASPRIALLSPLASRILAHHAPQGRSNDCGPYSAAILINTFCGEGVDPSNLARELDRIRWLGLFPIIRRIPRWATFPWGVADALSQRGLSAQWRSFGSASQLIRALNTGKIPVVFIGSYRPLWGHVMVLLACNPQRGWGFADPGWPTAELHWLSEITFRSQWRTYANTWVEVNPQN
ncbi:MAG: hypothetical protein PHQ40_13000 [Anaerolineaceae bacterium]|nr:hypothetical protein [Anaerolineaceae bacterium]